MDLLKLGTLVHGQTPNFNFSPVSLFPVSLYLIAHIAPSVTVPHCSHCSQCHCTSLLTLLPVSLYFKQKLQGLYLNALQDAKKELA